MFQEIPPGAGLKTGDLVKRKGRAGSYRRTATHGLNFFYQSHGLGVETNS